MKTVPAREANQKFSKLLADAAGGEEVVITKRGQPVVKMVAVCQTQTKEDRERAIKRMVRRMRKGVDMGGSKFTRDEMHER